MPLPGHPATNGLITQIRRLLDEIEALNAKPGATSGDANNAILAACDIDTPLARLKHNLANGKDFIDGD